MVEQSVEDVICPDKVNCLRPKETMLPAYLWKALQMPFVRLQIEAAARMMVGNLAIGTDDIRKLALPLSPLPVQRRLVAKVAAQRRKIEHSKAEVEARILGTKAVDA